MGLSSLKYECIVGEDGVFPRQILRLKGIYASSP